MCCLKIWQRLIKFFNQLFLNDILKNKKNDWLGYLQRMVENQFLILKTGKGKESIISPPLSVWTELMDNQIVDEGQNYFISIIQLINEKEIVELRYHHFDSPHWLNRQREITGREHQWLLRPPRGSLVLCASYSLVRAGATEPESNPVLIHLSIFRKYQKQEHGWTCTKNMQSAKPKPGELYRSNSLGSSIGKW